MLGSMNSFSRGHPALVLEWAGVILGKGSRIITIVVLPSYCHCGLLKNEVNKSKDTS